MTVQEVKSYKACDGTLFASHGEAAFHEVTLSLKIVKGLIHHMQNVPAPDRKTVETCRDELLVLAQRLRVSYNV